MPSVDTTLVFIQVDGRQYDFWEEYSCSSSMFEADSPFEFTSPIISDQEMRDVNGLVLAPGKVVQVFVRVPSNRPKASLQYTGILKSVDLEVGRDSGARLKIGGRSHMATIVDSDVMPGFSLEGLTFADLIRQVLVTPRPGATFGYYSIDQVVIDNDANRALLTGNPKAGAVISSAAPLELETLKIDQAKPHAGESVYHYIQRHATRFGLMIWGTADGKVVIGRPNYDQPALYQLQLRTGVRGVENDVLGWSSSRSFENRASEYHVYGYSKGGDQMRSPIHAVVHDTELEDMGLYRPATFHDNNARTIAQAEQRARLEMSKRLQGANRIDAVVQGHGQAGSVWSTDTVVGVSCDFLGLVNDPRYIVGRTLARSRGGTTARLSVTTKNAIVLGDVQYVPPKTTTAGTSSPVVATTKNLKGVQQAIAIIAGGADASGGVLP